MPATRTAPPDPKAAGGTRIQSVGRAARLLLWVADRPESATAKEIAEANGLTLPTAYHLLNTLVDEGLLAKDSARRYILGRGTATLAQAYMRAQAVPENLLATVRDLARRTEETAYLTDWHGYDMRVLASLEGRHILRVGGVASGTYEHGHARANGKVLLAHAPPDVRQAYLRTHPLVPVTKATICDADRFDRELDRIRKRGYAYDDEEYAEGVCCVGAPLMLNGNVTAALGVTVPAERFKQRRADLTALVLDIASGWRASVDPDPS